MKLSVMYNLSQSAMFFILLFILPFSIPLQNKPGRVIK